MRELIVIIVFALFFAFFSSLVEFFLRKNKKIIEISKKIERFAKRNEYEKVFENYLKLFRISFKYTVINLFLGIFIFSYLIILFKNFEIFVPLFNLKVNWMIIYFILVFLFTFIFKKLFYKKSL